MKILNSLLMSGFGPGEEEDGGWDDEAAENQGNNENDSGDSGSGVSPHTGVDSE